jgi:uncharacterized protein
MPRPRKIRLIQAEGPVQYYKPRGIPLSELRETVLSLDGLEALRLADVEGLEQVDAGQRMGISRSTFSRLLTDAHRAVGTALANGWALRIGGGPVAVAGVCEGRPRRRRRHRSAGGPDDEPSA